MADIGHRFDDVLRNLAGQAGSLEALLGVFFSFLHRNTDFYVTFDPAKTSRAGMGFPSGKAEEILLRAFRSLPFKPYGGGASGGGDSGSEGEQQRRQRPAAGGSRSTAAAPVSGSTSVKKKTPPGKGNSASGAGALGSGGSVAKAATAEAPPNNSPPAASPPEPPAQSPGECNAVSPSIPPQSGAMTTAAGGGIRVRYTKDGKQVPIGNGGVTARYYWTQTVNEATVYVDVPPGTRSKDVHCVIQPRRLKLRVRGAGDTAAAAAAGAAATKAAAAAAAVPGAAAAAGGDDALDGATRKGKEGNDGDLIFDGELPSAVSREGSMWSLNDGTTVVISFEKSTKTWWKSVVDGDPEIDTSQVDSTTKLSEYDGETQGAIRKIMFDQRQKSLGLPTSDQLSADAVLERAKGLPGSPFLPGGILFEGDGGRAGRGSGGVGAGVGGAS